MAGSLIKKSGSKGQNAIICSFNFVNQNQQTIGQIIFWLILQIKQIFNISLSIDYEEDKLKTQFNYWLSLANNKIEEGEFYNQFLVIIV